jgi:hypothetical protein
MEKKEGIDLISKGMGIEFILYIVHSVPCQ